MDLSFFLLHRETLTSQSFEKIGDSVTVQSPCIPELQLQEYCNLLKKLKEEFVVHSFIDSYSYDCSFNSFSNPMQINIRDDTDTWGCLHLQQHLYVL